MSTVVAHITGTIWKVEKQIGDRVEPGDVVVIIESMKMEMPVEADVGGTVADVACAAGDAVVEGQALMTVTPD